MSALVLILLFHKALPNPLELAQSILESLQSTLSAGIEGSLFFSSLEDVTFNNDKDLNAFRTTNDDSIDEKLLREELQKIVQTLPFSHSFDYFLCNTTQYYKPRLMAAFDMDSCILGNECIDEMGAEWGVVEKISEITRKAMNGEYDFDQALKERVSLLNGMTSSQLENVWKKIELNRGAVLLIEYLQHLGIKVALISGGFTFFTHRVASRLKIHYAFSNTLELEEEKLTGKVVPPIVNGLGKAKIVEYIAKKEGFPLDQVIAMGDGSNDKFMIQVVGTGVAYHAKAALKQCTPHHINNSPLHALLYLFYIDKSKLDGEKSETPSSLHPSLHTLALDEKYPDAMTLLQLFEV
eukprot:TRINITY_DN13617_c0_g1_i1.p1 TRINITY_DN13617_c0_g1~~TRINITY_DN13617_c0_g1_i1.p1  ORF type:complete len:364 (+),score=84.64 TRINITY_DN13617_c0_g1_i1:38-1093(+)